MNIFKKYVYKEAVTCDFEKIGAMCTVNILAHVSCMHKKCKDMFYTGLCIIFKLNVQRT